MDGLGEELRRAREARGIDLQQAEEETKIRRKYLECLETERFEELPGRVYSIGFIRSYARYLGLDGDTLVGMFKEKFAEQQDEAEEPVLIIGKRSHGRGLLWIILLLLALLAAGLYWNFYRGAVPLPAQQPTPQAPVTAPPGEAPPSQVQETPTPPPVIQEVRLQLTVERETCWMEVQVDGRFAYSGTLRPGDSKEFTGRERVYLYMGNAGAVRVKLNGQDMGLMGKPGEVVRVNFTASGMKREQNPVKPESNR